MTSEETIAIIKEEISALRVVLDEIEIDPDQRNMSLRRAMYDAIENLSKIVGWA